MGPNLPRPHSDTVKGSRFKNMKELRTQHAGKPYRTLYAFDPRRAAILLIGGNKAGNDNWYETVYSHSRQVVRRTFRTIEKLGELNHG